jgi:hypothetical protein
MLLRVLSIWVYKGKFSNSFSLPILKMSQQTTSQSVAPRRTSRVLWTDSQIQTLINERRRRNFEYWYLHPGRSKVAFWQSVADQVNLVCNTTYSGTQCKNKFNSLVSEFFVSKNLKKRKILLYIS